MQRQYHLFLVLFILAIIIFAASQTPAQDSQTAKRLTLSKATVTVRGEVGGESQDQYALNLKANRKVRIVLYSEQNKADFSICNERGGFGNSDICASAKDVRLKYFTKSKKVKYRKAKQWTGRIPQTGNYIISVVAYPGSARYTLQIKLEPSRRSN